MKTNKWMTRLLSGALVALGFTACDDENNGDYPDDYPLEYGSPSVEYRVKGTVTDEAGNPIETFGSLSEMRGQHAQSVYGRYGLHRQARGICQRNEHYRRYRQAGKFTSMTSTEKPTEALSNRTARILPIWKARK